MKKIYQCGFIASGLLLFSMVAGAEVPKLPVLPFTIPNGQNMTDALVTIVKWAFEVIVWALAVGAGYAAGTNITKSMKRNSDSKDGGGIAWVNVFQDAMANILIFVVVLMVALFVSAYI